MKKFVMMSSLLALAAGGNEVALIQNASAAEANRGDSGFGDIVVTARRQSESLRDIPDAIQAFGSEALEQAGVTSVNDLSSLVSGFHVVEAQQPGVSMINIRGIGQSRFGEPPIAVVIDGVQQVSANQLTQDLFDIEQIEFLKGPQGALYGRNALGGAINIVTRKPGDHFEGSLQASYAEGDDYKIGAFVSTPIGEMAGLRLAASYRNRDGQIYNQTLDDYVDYDETYTVRGSLLLRPTDRVEIDFSGSYLDQKGGAAYYVPGPPNATREPVQGNLMGLGKRKLGDASVKFKLDAGDVTLQSVTAYSSVQSYIFEDLEWLPDDLLSATQDIRVKAMTQELRLSSNNSAARLRWVAGLYYLHIDQRIETNVFLRPDLTGLADPLLGSRISTKDDNNAYAIFGQLVYSLTDRFEVTAALRYDIDDRRQTDYTTLSGDPVIYDATFRSLQPKVSLAYKFDSGDLLYATVAKGFRSGGFNNNSAITRKFNPEELWNYELGFKTVLADRKLFVNGAAFYTPITDRQVYGIDLRTGADQFIVNPIPKSHIVGAELEVTAMPVHGLTLSFGGTVLRTKIDEYDPSILSVTSMNGDYRGNRLNQVPEWSVNAAIQYTADLGGGGKIIPRFDIRGSGGNYYWEIDNADKRDTVWLANARLTYSSDRFEIAVFANNLFDVEYDMEYVSPSASGHIAGMGIGARNMPRQFGVSSRVNF
ncbi:TonB-dependent receptor [Sphingopyxis yananensis]|uniref:TonB-dependent receptor n=1 Tax=Sphingopyxis yananensis TaxID=2886687 RepID=UPI001D10EC76|nr:TonB-dependent receptor [Sphingopyxis yananensis]MCC2603096.1 TonB-dependent receptor [Sphingopyxis yananensis]